MSDNRDNPFTSAARVAGEYERRAKAGELGPPPASAPYVGPPEEVAADAEVDARYRSIADPFRRALYYHAHGAALHRHAARRRATR